MATQEDLRLRGARDRLVDLLALGETAPLQETEVRSERLTVPIGDVATVPVVPGQVDVRYLLRRRDGQPSPPGPGKVGNGNETILVTPAIEEDVTYRVLGRKVDTGREAYLFQLAQIKVGLDTKLKPRIEAPLLDPRAAADTDPRIVDHGSQFVVKIEASQEAVDYRLVHLPAGPGAREVDLSAEVRGDRGTIELLSVPVFENTMVRVRVTKRFDPASGREDQSELIEGANGAPLELPLEVRPDPALAVTLEPSNVVAFGGEATVRIGASQASCRYQLHLYRLADSDFLFDDDVAGTRVAETALDDDVGKVRVAVPLSPNGEPTHELTAFGDALTGNGADLRLPVGTLADDSLILVKAHKEHSAIWLEESATALVAPDPDRRLSLTIPVTGASIRGDVVVSGGQPGAFYYLRRGLTGNERALPAYFHQLDERDQLNKGLGGAGEPLARRGLRIEVDLAIARAADGDGSPGEPPDPAHQRPESPTIELGRLPLGINLHVRAVKARSGVAVELSHPVPVFDLPQIQLEENPVDAGTAARILVLASHAGDRYQPFLDGEPVKMARNGNGQDLVFVTGGIEQPTTFELRVTRAGEGADVVEAVELPVGVKPTGGGT